ncbi:MAG: alpha/beta fold hydrolase [Chlamydiae bacterium]|nr:alpha/beta fold hydrolase [Chlamydiota bacterium]
MLITSTFGSIENNPIVFLHGFLGCKEDWLPIIESFKQTYFCICVDLPGHGDSELKQDPLQQVESDLLAIGKRPLIGIGYSLGGRILLEIQERNPSLFSHLCLFGSHPGLNTKKEKGSRKSKEDYWETILIKEDINSFLNKWYDQPLFHELKKNNIFQKTLFKRKKNDPHKIRYIYNYFRLSKQKLMDPTKKNNLFLYGELDECYQNVYKSFENIQTAVIEKVGHATIIENPVECAQKIKSFLGLLPTIM